MATNGALALLAEHAVRRRIGREGIALEGARFVAVALGAYVGQHVTVFPDPSGDMGVVHVFLETAAGREFLCGAVNVERLGLDVKPLKRFHTSKLSPFRLLEHGLVASHGGRLRLDL